jgi:hypothetical protein
MATLISSKSALVAASLLTVGGVSGAATGATLTAFSKDSYLYSISAVVTLTK